MSNRSQSRIRRMAAPAMVSVIALTLSVTAMSQAQAKPHSAVPAPTGELAGSSAQWIGRENPTVWPDNGQQNPAPLLRKEFSLGSRVKKASFTIVGLGYYEAWIDGKRIGDQVLDPPPSQYNQTAFSRTFDVTSSLRAGKNAIGVELGRGYFGEPTSAGDSFGYATAPWRSEPRLLAELTLVLANGTTRHVVTDGSWKIANSPTLDNLYLGESYDARQAIPGWNSISYNDAAWADAPEQPSPTQSIVPASTPPTTVVAALSPVHDMSLSDGSTVYDFGRVTAGWGKIATSGPAGSTVKLVYGEQQNPDGSVHQISNQTDMHVDSYTLAGTGTQTWHPSFTRHGFRYIQVSSTQPLTSFSIKAEVVHTDLVTTGSFTSSDPLLDKIHANQRTTILNNAWGIPTDTPWRDRQGWTADAYLYLDGAASNFGIKGLYTDWLRTFRDSQLPDGSLPVVAPNAGGFPLYNDPSWSGTIVDDAWDLYQHYGDRTFLADNYGVMTRWMNLMSTTISTTGNLYAGFSFGDWASPGAELNGTALFAPENSDLTANADLYREAHTLAGIASKLGHRADATRYSTLATSIETAFNAKFFNATTNVYATSGNPFTGGATPGYRQTSNVVPLAYDMVPAGHEKAVVANLVADIKHLGTHLNTGAIGTKLLLPTLTKFGRGQLAYRLATQTTYPSWGYWVKQGATTSWETWSIKSLDQSLDHAFLGTVEDWLYQDLAGIQPAAPGYAKVLIAPTVPDDLRHVSASVTSPRGKISVSWTHTHGSLVIVVTVPSGTPTEIRLPLAAADTSTTTGSTTSYRVYTVSGGTHRYSIAKAN